MEEPAPLALALQLQTALEPLTRAPGPAESTADSTRQGYRETIEEIEQDLPAPASWRCTGASAIGIQKALLAGNMDGLTQSEGTAVNTLLCDKMTGLRKQAIKVARDTGCSIQLVVKPNDAFGQLKKNHTFRTGYLNSFLAESYGPELPVERDFLDQMGCEIFEHVRKLVPDASKKELLKVAERLGWDPAKEQLEEEEEAEAEARREAERTDRMTREADRMELLLALDPASVVPALTKSVVTADEQPIVLRIKDMASDLFFRDCSKPAWIQLDFSDGRSTKGIEDVYKGVSREVLRKKPNHPYNCLCALRDFLDNGYWRDLGLSDPRQFFTWLFGILQDTERYKQVRARLNTVKSMWDGKLFAIFIRLLWDYGGQHGSIEALQQAFEAEVGGA